MINQKKPKEYGFLITGTIINPKTGKDEATDFSKFLSCNVGTINFDKDKEKELSDYSFTLKQVTNLRITAIGHGFEDDEFINEKGGKNTIVSVIKDVKKKLDEVSQELKLESSLAGKVSNFRLQACHQGKHAKEKEADIKRELKSYNSTFPIAFSCPLHYSHLERGTKGEHCYTDSNAKSPTEYKNKKEQLDPTLRTGNEYTHQTSIEAQQTVFKPMTK